MRRRPTSKDPTKLAETRCAIYTRKSSEEGLEQEFNSLHAQREACQAYILSQKHEGWRVLATLYDDGGISGGTMERPALKRLLSDISNKRVDLVVIYKVDRLTRSLADFAKLVDVFNTNDVSFVSVTQQFNTATSMGRLTLNMLLSFAQFEREVTGERIRDKIAASKRKGMWMGGHAPLGYDVQNRKLVVNEVEASVVNKIYCAYTDLGSVRLLKEHLAEQGVTSKIRHSESGRVSGGRPLLRGNLYDMLRNRIYRGEIAHHGLVHQGEHPAIVEQELWDRVQMQLADGRAERSSGTNHAAPSLLAGLVFDENGERLSPSHAKKGSKRYRYYVSRSLITGAKNSTEDGRRIPAGELEALVTTAIYELLAIPASLMSVCQHVTLAATEQKALLSVADAIAKHWNQDSAAKCSALLKNIIDRVDVRPSVIDIAVSPHRLVVLLLKRSGDATAARPLGRPAQPHVIHVPATLQRVGKEMRLVIDGPGGCQAADPTIAKLLLQAIAFRDQLLLSHGQGVSELSEAAGMSRSYFTRVMRLGFLSPRILADLAQGRHPAGLTAKKLLEDTRLPLLWADQRQALGFAQTT